MGQDLSIEEIAARRADLRHQRELLFRAEARSKRVSKIKSKTFRKLTRKRDEKNQVDMEDLQRLDPQKAEEGGQPQARGFTSQGASHSQALGEERTMGSRSTRRWRDSG